MERVLVVCGAGASSTFLVHAMRREIESRGARLSVEAVTLEGLPRAAHGASLVLVARHLELSASDIRASLASDIQIEVLPAISPMGSGPALALDIAERALARNTPSMPSPTPEPLGGPIV